MRRTAIAVVTLLLSAGCQPAAPAEGPAAPAAPVLSGASSRGGRFTLRRVAGAPVVILFLRGSWCPLCAARLRALAASAGEYRAAGVRIVVVTLDRPEIARRAARDLYLTFPLVAADTATFQRWGAWPAGRPVPLPGDFVLDGAGRLRFARVGGDAADQPSDVTLLAIVDSLRAAGALPPR